MKEGVAKGGKTELRKKKEGRSSTGSAASPTSKKSAAGGKKKPARTSGADDDDTTNGITQADFDRMVDGGTKYLKEIGDHGGKTRNNVGAEEDLDAQLEAKFDAFGADAGVGEEDLEEVVDNTTLSRDILLHRWNATPGLAFVGHNRNSITACSVAGNTVFYADKTGDVNVFHMVSQRKQTLKPTPKTSILSLATTTLHHDGIHESAKMERSTVSAITDDYVCCGGENGIIYTWNQKTLEYIGELIGHQKGVTSLTFRRGTSTLYSASKDGCLRSWSVVEKMPLEKLFGHKGHMWAVATQNKERCVTGGEDRILRFWKVDAGTTTDYKPEKTAIESVAQLDDGIIVSGTRGGTLSVFSVTRKAPIISVPFAHGYNATVDGTGLEAEEELQVHGAPRPSDESKQNSFLGNSISALATIGATMIFASGSCDGVVRLWDFVNYELREVQTVQVPGFINHLSFSLSGQTLAAVSCKEPRLGRWSTMSTVLNGIIVISAANPGEEEEMPSLEDKPKRPLQDEEFRPVASSKLAKNGGAGVDLKKRKASGTETGRAGGKAAVGSKRKQAPMAETAGGRANKKRRVN